jgi:hypothetical protein
MQKLFCQKSCDHVPLQKRFYSYLVAGYHEAGVAVFIGLDGNTSFIHYCIAVSKGKRETYKIQFFIIRKPIS